MPNRHDDGFPGSFRPRRMRLAAVTVEARTDPVVTVELRRCGPRYSTGEAWRAGRSWPVGRDPEATVPSSAANARGVRGYAAGR
ncbi:hypothetical protein ACFXOS_06310 [Streptomyces sp. NPDC059175]|uniref:hypothetical protein n=1 Tax=Streptomyces sp. NPDC059175 TaxID=3346757 RepID=UPI0036AB3086